MIKVSCKQCGKRYSTDEKYVGRKMKCRQCGATFEIQESSPPKPRSKPAKPAAKAAKAPPPKKKKKKKAPQRPQRDPLAELESIETDVQAAAPALAPKKKSGSLAPLIIGIIAVVFGLVAIGGGFIPSVGAYVAYSAAALALALGLVGLIMALTGPSKGMVWNISGVSLALLAVTITKPAPVIEKPAEPPPKDTSVEDAMAVLRQSFEALKNGDADGALRDAILPDDPQIQNGMKAAVSQLAMMFSQGQAEYEILEGEHRGDWVLIVTRLALGPMSTLEKQFMLKPDEQWKIVNDLVLAHPQVSGYLNEDYAALDQWYLQNEAAMKQKYLPEQTAQTPAMDPEQLSEMAESMGLSTESSSGGEVDMSQLTEMAKSLGLSTDSTAQPNGQ